MRNRTTLAIASVFLTFGALALTASREPVQLSLGCGTLGLPDGQVLIRIPKDPTGLRVEITTAPAQLVPDGRERTTLRVRAGTDSLSCYATDPSSFILDLSRVSPSTVHLAIEMPRALTFEARGVGDLPRGSMELAPTASGSFTW
jgi:hypothetical protein